MEQVQCGRIIASPACYGVEVDRVKRVYEQIRRECGKECENKEFNEVKRLALEVVLQLVLAGEYVLRTQKGMTVGELFDAITNMEMRLNAGWKILTDVVEIQRGHTLRDEIYLKERTGYCTDQAIRQYSRMLQCKEDAVEVLDVLAGIAITGSIVKWKRGEEDDWIEVHVEKFDKVTKKHTLVDRQGNVYNGCLRAENVLMVDQSRSIGHRA